MGIIAQDPVLLSGSLRLNLDLEGRFSDEALYDVLHQVQLTRESRTGSRPGSDTGYEALHSSASTLVDVGDVRAKQTRTIFNNLDHVIEAGGAK